MVQTMFKRVTYRLAKNGLCGLSIGALQDGEVTVRSLDQLKTAWR